MWIAILTLDTVVMRNGISFGLEMTLFYHCNGSFLFIYTNAIALIFKYLLVLLSFIELRNCLKISAYTFL